MKLSQPVRVTHDVLTTVLPALSLLDAEPAASLDTTALRDVLAFAFAAGDTGDALERAIEATPLGAAAWHAEDFVDDVFLADFVRQCLPVRALGQTHRQTGALLLRVLSSPPRDVATARMRQGVFAELAATPPLSRAAEQLLAELASLRTLLSRPGGARLDALERRLAVLRAVRDVVRLAASGLRDATSALARIHAWGCAASAQPGFVRLVDLLAYEQCATELDVRVRLGTDGKIRDFEVMGRREPIGNPFRRSRAQRLFTKLALFMNGDRFDDHELLARLVDDAFEGVLDLLPPLLSLAAGLEFYLAGLAFRSLALQSGLDVALPTFDDRAGHVVLGLWNPLLLSDGARVVPCDLRVAEPGTRVVLTGPNSGGKTRLLQAVAFVQILAQSGMYVPARDARVPWASGLFVSLIEHARADQSEGRLGTELLRIRRLFESLRDGSLVILDELCSGTNPDEGEDIFRLVVKLLAERKPAAFITTHFLRFAARLEAEGKAGSGVDANGLSFLRVELDGAERPTFQFVPGVASTSLAHKTAVRLGVTEEALRAAMATKERG